MDVFGKALLDYQQGRQAGDLVSHSSLGDSDVVPPSYFFRDFPAMPFLEQEALSLAGGRVLDIGSAAGCHSLILQERGLEVTALDTSPGALQAAQAQGVRQTVQADIREYRVGNFDTLLLLMNGIGLAGRRAGMTPFLLHLRSLLAPGGQILADSSDIIYMFDRDEDGGVWVPGDREYYGEVTYYWAYAGQRSEAFSWLFADWDTLQEAARQAGLQAELLEHGNHYDYLARLSL